MKISAEQLYINKVNGFLFGLRNKTKKVGDVDVHHLLNQIRKSNPFMADELEKKFDVQTNNIQVVTW